MNAEARASLLKKLDRLDQMPTLPVTLAPLLRYLEQPIDVLDIQQVVDMISQDKSLSAQCLHMANSPLFGRYQHVDTIRGAVVAIGLQRMRDIVLSCSVLKLTPDHGASIDPTVFWEHSFGCALVSRRFAQRIGFADQTKAYLAGLLHDIGIVLHLWLAPKEFAVAFDLAQKHHIGIDEAERETLGTTHSQTGSLLAERWDLSCEVVDVIAYHHAIDSAKTHKSLVALVALSDLLCRMHGLGYGYTEEREIDLSEQPEFNLLLSECPNLSNFDWARFTFELEAYVHDVHRLVNVLYRGHE